MKTLEKTPSLRDHQKKAVDLLHTGSILWGGVGSGKSRTALHYFFTKEKRTALYVITTARKRDSLDWEKEAELYGLVPIVDSWNNIEKYVDVENCFFIFDEQKVIGYGQWVKHFLKIAKKNRWILLSATPGDNWINYVPVFIANGFYKHKTDFVNQHVVWNTFTKFPKIDRYVGISKLTELRNSILVRMDFERKTIRHNERILVDYDVELYRRVVKDRWNPFTNEPLKESGESAYTMRKVLYTHPSRLSSILPIIDKHSKVIIFYNYNYELEILRKLEDVADLDVAEYNGHLHQDIPTSPRWAYLVQYFSGAEAWNCIETNCIIFYSQNYSYKVMQQSSGRIDRMTTLFTNLYYYTLICNAGIDLAIEKKLKEQKVFNESAYVKQLVSSENQS